MVTHAMEDYLAAVWRLTLDGGTASTSEVARKLGVTAASTSYMFRKLAEAGLVEYKEYVGASLTPKGEQAAMRFIRRHRINERFLVEVLGIPWDQADGISDQMEHSIPEEVIDRMHAVMGYPTTCPHGYPIPDKNGVMPKLRLRPLTELKPGEASVILQVAEHDPELLRYFDRHNLRPGTQVSVVGRDDMGGTLTIRLDNSQKSLVLGSRTAEFIRVEQPA